MGPQSWECYNPARFRTIWVSNFKREEKPMIETETKSSEARVALYFLAAAMLGSIIMALASNLLK
jgi:hypothetical protein